MAFYKTKFLSSKPADKRWPSEKVVEKSNTVQLKINRLKRPKGSGPSRSGGSHGNETPSVILEKGESYSSDATCVNCKEAGSEFAAHDKCSSTLSTKADGSLFPRLECDVLLLKKPLKQSKLKLSAMKRHCARLQISVPENADGTQSLHISKSAKDIIDLCGDESSHACGPDQVNVAVTGINVRVHHGRSDPPQATMTPGTMSSVASENDTKRSGRRAEFSEQMREEMLEQIQVQSRQFPARRFLSLLLDRRRDFEKDGGRLGDGADQNTRETAKKKSVPVCSVLGKRKREVESPGDVPPKRQHLSQDGGTRSADALGNPSSSRRGRLSVSWRKKQADAVSMASEPPSPSPPPSPLSVRQEDEVLWTEKYQPRHSCEVLGNSTSVRKLHCWLTEWRIRADVEDRRQRQEDCMMKAESKESWDCGDFKGELGSADGSADLCSTVLIQGPAGVGKTAAVYACAAELGFQVFEVNSSSLRRGQLILSQLSEATQSHQVGALQCATIKPSFFNGRVQAHSRKEASRKIITTSRPAKESSRAVSTKKRVIAPVITNFFKSTDSSVKRRSNHSQDTEGPDAVKQDMLTEVSSNTELAFLHKDPGPDRSSTKPPLSLILFEEVDIIFDEDVGFLNAIKTLMITTKRPIILTTSDSLFSRTFDGHFEEIHFRRPATESIGSYLQCLCVVENVQPDPENISFLLAQNKGDIRRSILELELWSRSGGGSTPHQLHKRALSCSSWSELESRGCLEVLVDSWRTGRSLFCSNPAVLLAPPSGTCQCSADTETATSLKTPRKGTAIPTALTEEQKPRRYSRLKGKKHKSTGDDHKDAHNLCPTYTTVLPDTLNQLLSPDRRPYRSTSKTAGLSADEHLSKLGSCCLDSLARFFESMSFLDSCLYGHLSWATGHFRPDPPGYIHAKVADSLLDEPREEELNPLDPESIYELLAVVEGLCFLQCRVEVSELRRTALRLSETGGAEVSTSPGVGDAGFWQKVPYEHSVPQKSAEILREVFSSKAFCCHGNKKAVVMDYLPALRSICRLEREKQNKPRSSHYLKTIHLPLSKSTLQLLASDGHLQSCWRSPHIPSTQTQEDLH